MMEMSMIVVCVCCTLALGFLLVSAILVWWKTRKFYLWNYLSVKDETRPSYVVKCSGLGVSCSDISFNPRIWNSLLLQHNSPLRVNCGNIEHFEVSVGWFLIGGISIHVKGAEILLNTTSERHYSPEKESQRMLDEKRSLIRRFDQLQGKTDLMDVHSRSYSRTERILLRIVLLVLRKMQVRVENVRIRVEDQNVISEDHTSVGIAVEKIELLEDKALRKSIGVKFSSAKQLSVSHLSFYLNPKEQLMYSDMPESERREKLKLVSFHRTVGRCYVLYPCSLSLSLTAMPGVIALLKVGVNSKMDSLTLQVSKDQLRVATLSLGHIKHLQNTVEFLQYRPTSGVHGHAKEWWVYAFNYIRHLQNSSNKWKFLDIVGQSDLKLKYGEAYSKLLGGRPTKDLKRTLQCLEDELSVMNILITRRKVEQQRRQADHSSSHALGRRRRWRNLFRHSSLFAGSATSGSLYSLSGQCDIEDLEVSLLTGSSTVEMKNEEEEIEIFTLKVFGSHIAVSKEQQKNDIVVTVKDALCLGVALDGCGNKETRPKILTWKESQEDESGPPVLFVQLCSSNGAITTNSPTPNYNYSLSCHLSPSLVCFDWPTVHKLAEFIAIVRGTHKDFRDAVKERVKEVGRESKLRFRHFIANKEQMYIKADINLPVFLFKMEHNPNQQLGLHFGQLSIETIDGDCLKDWEVESSSVEYLITLENTRLTLYPSDEGTSSLMGVFRGQDSVKALCSLATTKSNVVYTTCNDTSTPSCLYMNLKCANLYLGVDGELETMVQFCYDQMTSTVHFMKTMNSIPLAKDAGIQCSPSHLYTHISDVPSTEEESEIFGAIIGEEDNDFRSQDDHKIFEFDAEIELVEICLKESSGGPHLKADVHLVYLSCQLKEQATTMSAKVSSIALQDLAHQDENHDINICHTNSYTNQDIKFLDISLCFADSNRTLFSTEYESIEESASVEVNPLSFCIYYECVSDLLCWLSRMKLPPFKSLINDLFSAGSSQQDSNTRERQVAKPPIAGAVYRRYELKFCHLDVTLDTSYTSSLIKANVDNVLIEYHDRYSHRCIEIMVDQFQLTDDLMCDSPYHAVFSNSGSEPLVRANLSYKTGENRVHTKCDIEFGSLKLVYLHKLIRGLQVLVSSLNWSYSEMKKNVSLKLTGAGTKVPGKEEEPAPHHRNDEALQQSSVQYCYQVTAVISKCSVKLPRESFHPDALILKSKQLKLIFSNSPAEPFDEEQDQTDHEPDTDPSLFYEPGFQIKNELMQAKAEMIEFNWSVNKMKHNIARTSSFGIDKINSCWIIGFEDIEIFLSGESLASVPSLISSNFTEKDPYELLTIRRYSSPKQHYSHTSRRHGSSGMFDPFMKFVFLSCKVNIKSSEGVSGGNMATIELKSITITVGKAFEDNDGRGEGIFGARISVGGVCGVEGTDIQTRQKILTRYGSVDEKMCMPRSDSNSPMLEINIRSGSGGDVAITIGLTNVCLCLWPTFLHSLTKFKRQRRVKEGRRGKRWKSRRASTKELIEKRMRDFSKPVLADATNTQASSTGSMLLKVSLEKCCLAFLENPSDSEITTPGVVIEFHSNEQETKKGIFQFEYTQYSSGDWRWDLSSCWVSANLCLFGETILPLTKVVPPCCLSLIYSVVNLEENVEVKVPSFECHITSELYEVICKFYSSTRKRPGSSTDTSSIMSDDIWSIKDFERTSVLPERPVFEETDGIDVPSVEFSDDEYDVDSSYGTAYETQDTPDKRQQEATLYFNDVTFNFDLMCSGDSDSVPIMSLHSCIYCIIKQWSYQPAATTDLTLESFIYNEQRATWEPFIEPINDSSSGYRPYRLNVKFGQVTGLIPGEEPSSVLANLHTSPSFASISSIGKDSNDFSKQTRGSISDSSLTLSEHFSMPSPQASPYLRKKLPTSTPYRTEGSLDSSSGSRLVKPKDSSSEGEGSIEEDKSTYILLFTSNDRLELTVTPSALQTIQMYSKVLELDYQTAMANIRNCVQDSRPPVRIENKTISVIKVFPGPTFKDGDSSYNNHFKIHHHSLKHFPSVVDKMLDSVESPDHEKLNRQPTLPTIKEEASCSPVPSPSLLRTQRGSIPRPQSPFRRGSAENGIPLFFQRSSYSRVCSVGDDEELYDEASVCSTERDDEIPFANLLGEIEIIDESMTEAFDGEEGDDAVLLEKIDPKEAVDSNLTKTRERSKKKSVHHIKSLINVNQQGPTDQSNEQATSDYWKPKSLRKCHKIKIQMPQSSKSKTVPVSLPGVFAVPVTHEQYGRIALICEVSLKKGVRKVLIKSGLQIKNTLPFQVAVYSLSGKDLEKLGELERDEGALDLPLRVVADKNHILKFGVGSDGHPCNQSIHWKMLTGMKNGSQVLVCPESTSEGAKFFIQASIKLVPAAHLTIHSPSHIITLEPALVIHNHLPLTIDFTLQLADSGTSSPLFHLDPCDSDSIFDFPPIGETIMRLSLEYHNLAWSGEGNLKLGSVFSTTIRFRGFDKRNPKAESKMYINIQTKPDTPNHVHLYTPYWVVNKTNIDLEFEHQPSKYRAHTTMGRDESHPLLLTYKSGKIDEQHKVKLKVTGGEWSKAFLLGAIGKIINVTSICKRGTYPHEFALETRLLDSTLTEIIYVMPKYSIVNYTDVPLVCTAVENSSTLQEDTSVIVQARSDMLTPFWPGRCDQVDVSLSNNVPFPNRSIHYIFSLSVLSPTVIKTNDPVLPVMTIKIQPDPIKGTTVISICPQVDPGAMLKIQNLCRRYCIRFMQRLVSGSGQLYPLDPNQSILYTWDCPVGKREINWQVDGALEQTWTPIKFDKPKQEGFRRVLVRKNDSEVRELITIFWLTLFEGSQLVLRFFDCKNDYKWQTELKKQLSPDDFQFFCSLEGVGISLVNSTPTEVAYCTVMSSPVLWMKRRGQGGVWSGMPQEQSERLEEAFRMQKLSVDIKDETYNLQNMIIQSSKGGEISRGFNPGIWVWYSQCNNRSSLSVKLGRVQMDNQLKTISLPTRVVFAEKNPTYAGDIVEGGVPFLDLEVIINTHGRNAVREYEKVLLKIKPCQVNIDLGLVAALLPYADASFAKPDKSPEQVMKQVGKSLYQLMDVENLVVLRTVNYIDLLQIDATSVAVNYTTAGDYDLSSKWGSVVNAVIHFALITKGLFNVSLKSVKISNEITNITQLKWILWGHYKNEVLWQFQHFALGLDVIGNPAKLFGSFQTGAKDLIFKSREGIAEGEAGSGIALGVKSLLGHVIGGGASSLIDSTSSIGNLLLAATDIDYQKQHRHMKQTNKSNITSGGKSLAKGVITGATDIFVKPATGATKEGVEGFFKGIGIGAVSILVKPTLGMVDLINYSMEGVRSAVDDITTVQTVRRPRFIQADGDLQPYNNHESEGRYIFDHLSQPLRDEQYVAHQWLPAKKQKYEKVILVTTKQLLQLNKTQKQYCVEWSTSISNIEKVQAVQYCDNESPELSKQGLFLEFTSNKAKKEIMIHLESPNGAKDVQEKIKSTIKDYKSKVQVLS